MNTLLEKLDEIDSSIKLALDSKNVHYFHPRIEINALELRDITQALRTAVKALEGIRHAEMFVDYIDHNFQGAIDIAKTALASIASLARSESGRGE